MKVRHGILPNYRLLLLRSCFVLVLLFSTSVLPAQETIVIVKQKLPLSIGKNIAVLVDNNERYNSANILVQKAFTNSDKPVPLFNAPKNNIWIRFKIQNSGSNPNLNLSINYADISSILLYEKDSSNKLRLVKNSGNNIEFYKRGDDNINYNFNLNLKQGAAKVFYLHVSSLHPYELPIFINDIHTISLTSFKENLIIGLYCGIILSTILYNLFLFFATRDKNYFFYVAYLFILWFAQITFEGWAFKFLWPLFPELNSYVVICTSLLGGIMGIVFAKFFLNTAFYTPLLNKALSVLIIFYILGIAISFSSYSWISYMVFNYAGIAASILLLYTSVVIYKKGNTSALFYLIAWSAFLLGFIIYLLKNLNIIPFNDFTHFILYIGSALEAVLLSFALANKINILRNEKEQSQAESLRISKENEQLIQQQNIVLEQKITERTQALELTLSNLKDAQMQLVESEKMASLGQLTAGIAHEINNPINFVKSNVRPLQLDVHDLFELINRYQQLHTAPEHKELPMLTEIKSFEDKIDPDFIKEEIENLIGGIEEGAERTAEIVRSLRNFSRLDESEIKTANVHEGIDSTLVLLKNTIPAYIKIVRDFNANGEIECYPSKLNQVFMNILTNAVQAIKTKSMHGNETVTISTCDSEGYMKISIKDTGVGMTEEVKHKIFDPFFTTKEVGEGTGLGMSITFKIIEKHQGKIALVSSPGNGSEIILSIPYQQSHISTIFKTDDDEQGTD